MRWAAPDFSITAAAADSPVAPGAAVDVEVAFRRVGGFDDALNVSLVDAPRGFSAENSVARAGAATLRVHVGQGVAPGRYEVTVKASAAGVTRTATLTIVVRV